MKYEYKNVNDILKWHGLFAFIGYWFCNCPGAINSLNLWEKIGKLKILKKFTWNAEFDKLKPWWQDLVVLIIFLTTCIFVFITFNRKPSLFIVIVIWYFLFDIFIYFTKVLWFDRYAPNKPAKSLKVFSQIRVLFQAIISYSQSILLFGMLYSFYDKSPKTSRYYQKSFEIATSLGSPTEDLKIMHWLSNMQIVISLFLLIVVISVIASVGYKRGELAPDPSKDNSA